MESFFLLAELEIVGKLASFSIIRKRNYFDNKKPKIIITDVSLL